MAGSLNAPGFPEDFNSLYSDVADALPARREGKTPMPRDLSYPTVRDGVIGLKLVETVEASHGADGAWTDATTTV